MKSSENFAACLTPFCEVQGILTPVNYIRAWREHAGLKQDRLGAALNPPASAGTISSYETGKRRVGAVRLEQMAAVLGTTPGKLLDEPPPAPGSKIVPMSGELVDLWQHILERGRTKEALALLRVIAEPDEGESGSAQR
jgi:transcriptional regulator with XRE-family HTH domain